MGPWRYGRRKAQMAQLTALFGGFTPMIATYLIEVTKNTAMPGAWLSCAAFVSLLAAVLPPAGTVAGDASYAQSRRSLA